LPVSVAKIIRTRRFSIQQQGCTQAVHRLESAQAIGAQAFDMNLSNLLMPCLARKKIFGTHPAEYAVRIFSSRFLT